jgi:hypothetical protein
VPINYDQVIRVRCGGWDPDLAHKNFLDKLISLGAELLDTSWLGSKTGHRVRCAYGHVCFPTPDQVKRGKGICVECAYRKSSPAVAERDFRQALAKEGATLLETGWLGSSRPHSIRCKYGHICCTRPAGIHQGKGICRYCANMIWDVFYIVSDGRTIKFGITSGNPSPRLSKHAKDGFTEIIRVYTELPDTMAPDIESMLIDYLKDYGIKPVRGREYYPIECLDFVSGYVDNCMGIDLFGKKFDYK